LTGGLIAEGRGEGVPPLPLGEGRGDGAPPLPLGEGRGEGGPPPVQYLSGLRYVDAPVLRPGTAGVPPPDGWRDANLDMDDPEPDGLEKATGTPCSVPEEVGCQRPAKQGRRPKARGIKYGVPCAVKRRWFSAGENPARQLSLRPVAIGAVAEVTKRLKPPV